MATLPKLSWDLITPLLLLEKENYTPWEVENTELQDKILLSMLNQNLNQLNFSVKMNYKLPMLFQENTILLLLHLMEMFIVSDLEELLISLLQIGSDPELEPQDLDKQPTDLNPVQSKEFLNPLELLLETISLLLQDKKEKFTTGDAEKTVLLPTETINLF